MIRRAAPPRRSSSPIKRTKAPKRRGPVDSVVWEPGQQRGLKLYRLPQDQTHRQRVVIANDLWRRLIYRKEPSGLCPRCHTRQWHDAAHCWAKGPYPGMRFDLDNGAPLCRACHRRVDSDHQAKVLFFQHYLGLERYARLELMSQARGKTDVALVILFLRSIS